MKSSSRKILGGLVALLFVVSIVQSQAIVSIAKKVSGEDQTAQIFGATSPLNMRPTTRTYSVADNVLGQTGIYFPVKKIVTVTACGAGGGGGGGGRGNESGSDEGAGGGGGGGGGKGNCEVQTLKIRPGDTLRWLVGTGGQGGVGGNISVLFEAGVTLSDTSATSGTSGGTTYVSINGVDVMQVYGGWGGYAGSNAANQFTPGMGGVGGSYPFVNNLDHNGKNGEVPWDQTNMMGYGGRGGRGADQNGLLSNSGDGGVSFGANFYGADGGPGSTFASGGGGGGGGAGRWYDGYFDMTPDIPDNSPFNVFEESVGSRGGSGGPGGNGTITISW
jgi:hypothetical protein